MHVATAALSLAIVISPAIAADSIDKGELFSKATGEPIDKTIERLLVDNAAGAVSAAALAGVESDSLTVVENVRDFSLLIKSFDASANAFGLAVTPARTNFPVPGIRLRDYAADGAHLTRLLGALTFSYAQGKSDIEKTSFTRRAISVATSEFWNADEDPIVVAAKANQCGHAAVEALGSDRPTLTQSEVDRLVEEAKKAGTEGQAARRAQRATTEQETASKIAWDDCITPLLKKAEVKWNRTRYSISYATGSIKRTDASGDSVGLGHTFAASLVYGFDAIKALRDSAALTLTMRRSEKEPVLTSLVNGPVVLKNSTLVAVRLSGGSSVFRGLIEANNAKETDITTSQRTFRRALGIDYRVMDGLWLNLRYGKQHKLDGSGQDETGSFLALNYSPSALLGR